MQAGRLATPTSVLQDAARMPPMGVPTPTVVVRGDTSVAAPRGIPLRLRTDLSAAAPAGGRGMPSALLSALRGTMPAKNLL
jgi:hypothetical protein